MENLMDILNHLDEAITSFDREFTTHELIIVLAKNNQREHIDDLTQQKA
jgi:hypothetical protein